MKTTGSVRVNRNNTTVVSTNSQIHTVPPPFPFHKKGNRFDNLDMARGIAIFGMFLSHTVKGLLAYEQMPAWGIVPVHLLTKFSSSLFILIFGISLSLFFLPSVDTLKWPQKRNRLLFRSLEIMFWYKLLTFFQMFQTYPREAVVDTLMFKAFPDFVEVLGFYAFCLMWIPFFLPFWKRSHIVLKCILILSFSLSAYWLNKYFDFWGIVPLKNILVEQDGYFTYGQLSRGALVLFGLLLGDFLRHFNNSQKARFYLGGILLILSLCCGILFYYISGEQVDQILLAIAKNHGKHPPNLHFMTFSLMGAFGILSLSIFGYKWLPEILKPFTIIGKNSLDAFIVHIFIIFVLYRYVFNLRARVTYPAALVLTGILFIATTMYCHFRFNKKKG